ncbi:hypothetical protein ANCDUO_20514, partial [Ancylostoma duodenale]
DKFRPKRQPTPIHSSQWDGLRSACCPGQSTMSCDFYNSPNVTCKTKANSAISNWINNQLVHKLLIYRSIRVNRLRFRVEEINMYQDCYRQHIGLGVYKASLGLAVSVQMDVLEDVPKVAHRSILHCFSCPTTTILPILGTGILARRLIPHITTWSTQL